ncbi:MAG: TolC family protein [Planctomycetes bacterium]|nr:TolC family protein [Planctomycetota bacterium]MCL4730328.1 TolC family protein [Planctomycetota bacterium]
MSSGRLLGLGLTLPLLLAACHTPAREVEPSEAFRAALDEVMLRQPPQNKVKADELDRRKQTVVLALTLDDCIELAMSRNTAVLFDRLAAEVAAADVMGSRAPLDFTVGANFGYTRTERPVNSRFPGDSRDQDITAVTNYGLNARLPFETGTTVTLTGGFVRNDSNSPFQTFEFFPETTLNIRQSLLRGFGFVPNLGNVWIADNNRTIADLQVDATRNAQAYAVAVAYWDLVEAGTELGLFVEESNLAQEALKLAQSRLDAGIGTRLDVLTQQAAVKNAELNIINARNNRDARTDALIRAMHPDLVIGYALFRDYRVEIDPRTPADVSSISGDLPVVLEEVKAALRRRPEILQARKRIENAGISIQMGEHGLLPTLDLVGEFGVNGSGREFDDSLNSYDDFENLKYGFSLEFSVSLQNRSARAALTRAQINRRNALLAARQTETDIILEVAAAVRGIRSAREAVAAAEESFKAQDEIFKATSERADPRIGLATPFEVDQARKDRTAASINHAKARIGLQKARLALMKATGEMGR